jgi:LL-H family phage holin
MDQFTSDIINGLIVALIPVAIGALGYVAKQVINLIKANVSREQYAMLEKIAAATVQSLNQTLASKAGEEKKAAALALVRDECAKRGIKLDEQAIATAIEAAVYREKLKA